VDLQSEFVLGETNGDAPAVASDIRDEIARVWGLPLGQRVLLSIRGQERIDLRGRLDLVVSPGYPWDRREPLRLKVAGVIISSPEISHWVIE